MSQVNKYQNHALNVLERELLITREKYRDAICNSSVMDSQFHQTKGKLSIIEELINSKLKDVDDHLTKKDDAK